MLVRNEATIVADSIGHLLNNLRIWRLYVADNGSTDATPRILQRIAALDKRVSILHAPGPYRPEAVMATLVSQAMDGGANWILPTDADEFLWISASALRRRLAAMPAIGAYRLPVCNFVQFGTVGKDRAGSVRTMLFRAVPEGTEHSAHLLVHNDGLPFLRSRYQAKIIVRASPALRIYHGHHHADGLAGPIFPTPLASVLHAPIRSRDDLHSRVLHGRRVLDLSDDPDTSWHLKRLVEMDDTALDREWRINSVCRPIDRGFRFDLRLAWLGYRLSGFRKQVAAAAG
jgi:glycosyltransferase involved in cell wall biosynthesis